MNDPYKVLGVSPSASDDEVKKAYREMAKKYHPDQYANTPLAELAGEKMKEVNDAYDTIVKQRKEGRTGGAYGNGGYSSYNNYNNGYNNYGYNTGNSSFADVRRLITTNRIADAEQILDGVPGDRRNAEWYFLKGVVLMRRGWLDEARNHFARACQMDPGNMEYRQALNQFDMQRQGGYNGYGYGGGQYRGSECNSCDVCSSLMCADCCCECMGGDLVPCC
ncbi:MAG: DnaJ domain-containing protein [Clostridia bacterium]|nr:DnaJ domain-containing protein [Clostridia bacterium]